VTDHLTSLNSGSGTFPLALFIAPNSSEHIIHAHRCRLAFRSLTDVVRGRRPNYLRRDIILHLRGMRCRLCNPYWSVLFCSLSLSVFPHNMPTHNAQQVKQLDADLLTSLAFLPRALITASKAGHVRLWVRPLVMANASPRRRHTRGTLSVTDFQG
jgi:hypothetical protein